MLESSDSNQLSAAGMETQPETQLAGEEVTIMEFQGKREGQQDETANLEDPFRVRLDFSLAEWVKMGLVLVLLVPLRVVVASIALTTAWAVSCIGLLGCDLSLPVCGWRRVNWIQNLHL